jgi:hypothetical protein
MTFYWTEIRRVLLRVVLSIIGAGIAYTVWLASFLLVSPLEVSEIQAIAWFLAPIATALGFTLGLSIADRFNSRRTTLRQHLLWPLVGCAVGAASVYWYGPMLIVFGMFGLGTLAVALKELKELSKL